MIETVPVAELTTDAVRDFVSGLETYRALYHDLFRRRYQREQYDQFVRGLLLDLPNRSVETTVLHMQGGTIRSLNRRPVAVIRRAHKHRQITGRRHREPKKRNSPVGSAPRPRHHNADADGSVTQVACGRAKKSPHRW